MKILQVLCSTLTLILVATLSACSEEAPNLPVTDGEMLQKLTGSEGSRFLRQISTHAWPDGGTAAGRRFAWIAEGAPSNDPTVTQGAGEAAHAIGSFLADPDQGLTKLPAGIFGSQHRSLGELNPGLVAGYADALTHFQGALVGDIRGVLGFEVLGDPLNLAAARNIFTIIDTNTNAGIEFNTAAYERVGRYLQTYGQSVANRDIDGLVALQYAAALAGVVEGAQRDSNNAGLQRHTAQHFVNLARYEVAKSMGVRLGAQGIPARFFTKEGDLKSPDAVSQSDLSEFSTALENFAFGRGLSSLGVDFRRWYDVGAGN